MASYKAVMRALIGLSFSYPNAPRLEPEHASAYSQILEPIPDELLEMAVSLAARRSPDFIPAASKIYQAALDLLDREPPATEAWGMVMAEIRRGGSAENLTPRTREALVNAVGWQELRNADESTNLAHRARFIEAYKDREKVERTRAMALPPGVVLALPDGRENERR